MLIVELRIPANVRTNFAYQPDVLKLGAIFRPSLKIELNQSLECGAFFGVARKPFRSLPKIIPRIAGGDKSIW
jgi:hypothetical protein